jgi:hypothetical protein
MLEARLTRPQGWELVHLIDREQPAEKLELKLGEVVPYAQPPVNGCLPSAAGVARRR